MAEYAANDQRTFEHEIQALEAEIASVATHLAIEGKARQAYTIQIRNMASEWRQAALSGRITWAEAAKQAHEMRNTVMDIIRGQSTPVGRAFAEKIKKEGPTLDKMISKKTHELFGKSSDFNRLSAANKNRVYAAIVESAGKSNAKVNAQLRVASRAGRGLLFMSIALSVYQVAAAEDKVEAAKREAAVTGAGFVGAVATGAAAGLWCGPVCVGIGAFVGGACAAYGVDTFWE